MNAVVLTDVQEQPVEVLAKHGRSFWLASLFLPSNQRLKAARLYAFCRTIDDAVDEAPSETVARARIERYLAELNGDRAPSHVVADFVELNQSDRVSILAARDLLAGCESDLNRVRLRDEHALAQYRARQTGIILKQPRFTQS